MKSSATRGKAGLTALAVRETSAGIQHELLPQASVNATYFRRSYGNFNVTDNRTRAPSDYDPFCITAPVDARLPGGGGNQICGLYDINPVKLRVVPDNFVTFADKYGKQTEIYNGADFTTNIRLPHGVLVAGGINIGSIVLDVCDVQGKVDNPATAGSTSAFFPLPTNVASPGLRFCRQRKPFQTQVNLMATVGLPWGIDAATVFQSIPGTPITASYVARNAEIVPTLGRNLSAGANGTAVVDLIEPYTEFEDRLHQVDLRLAKTVTVGRTRLKGMVDLYNMFNASAILALVDRYGPIWLQPRGILPGRLIKFGTQIDF